MKLSDSARIGRCRNSGLVVLSEQPGRASIGRSSHRPGSHPDAGVREESMEQNVVSRPALNPPRSALVAIAARAIGMASAGLLLSSCASNPYWDRDQDIPQDLLTGVAVFGDEVRAEEAPEADILAVTPQMQAYVEESLSGGRYMSARFKRIMKSLLRDGYFTASYQPNRTNTAAETFEQKAGNCLSYTNMFIALARASGLDARYQVVDVPPSWDADDGYLIRYTHVNVLLKGVRFDKAYGEDFTVDFNEVHPDVDDPARVIDDSYASALFYANRSVNLFRQGENRQAFAYLRRAIELVPDNMDFWLNLGAFYAKLEHYNEAIRAYERVLQLDRDNRGAMSGLGRAYQVLGDDERADYYITQVKRYRDSNAYYHFAIAQTEFEKERYAEALNAINTAIELKKRNGRFYFMKGLTEQKLGNLEAARESFKRASRHGSYRDLKRRYGDEVAGITFVSS